MAELLRDNLEAQRRAALQETLATPGPSMPCPRREVPDILSWVQCFSIYTAVIASKFPERVQKLLAYQTLIVREARRCGGRGWLSYDAFFRQQMVGEWRGDEWGRLSGIRDGFRIRFDYSSQVVPIICCLLYSTPSLYETTWPGNWQRVESLAPYPQRQGCTLAVLRLSQSHISLANGTLSWTCHPLKGAASMIELTRDCAQ